MGGGGMLALSRQAFASEQWDSFSHQIQSSLRLACPGVPNLQNLDLRKSELETELWGWR